MNEEKKDVKTLADALPEECARVRKLIEIYRDPTLRGAGAAAIGFMEASLQNADKAMASGDVVAMLQAYQDLKGYTE